MVSGSDPVISGQSIEVLAPKRGNRDTEKPLEQKIEMTWQSGHFYFWNGNLLDDVKVKCCRIDLRFTQFSQSLIDLFHGYSLRWHGGPAPEHQLIDVRWAVRWTFQDVATGHLKANTWCFIQMRPSTSGIVPSRMTSFRWKKKLTCWMTSWLDSPYQGCLPKEKISQTQTPNDQTSDSPVNLRYKMLSGDIHRTGRRVCPPTWW